MRQKIAVISGFRSAMGKAGGVFKNVTAYQLGSRIAKETLNRSNINGNLIDEVIIGNVAQPAEAANIARVISVNAGLSQSIPAYTVHRNCASGMESFISGMLKINYDDSQIIMCGGVESMSNIPLLVSKELTDIITEISKAKTLIQKLKIITKIRPKYLKPRISLIDGLTDPLSGLIMGLTAENIARDFKISRKEQDDFALRSHILANKASEMNIFDEEIIAVFNNDEKDPQMVDRDEGIRAGQNIEDLAKLKPYFDKYSGTVTVGNSSQITDGAAIAIIAGESRADEIGIMPMGFILDFAITALDPSRMGLGPVFAITKILQQNNIKISDIDLFEINEAFSAQVLGCIKALNSDDFCRKHFSCDAIGEIPIDKLNVNGGAVAMGHPVGMSGARIIIHALNELKRRNKRYAIVSLCVGGGQGVAVLLENNIFRQFRSRS